MPADDSITLAMNTGWVQFALSLLALNRASEAPAHMPAWLPPHPPPPAPARPRSFDLIYLILDKYDESRDRRLARHLVSLFHAGAAERSRVDEAVSRQPRMRARMHACARCTPRHAM